MDIKADIPKINKNDLLEEVLKKLKLQFGTVEVGFFYGDGKYKSGRNVSTVARYNDKGNKNKNIPKREFMIPAGNKASNKVINTSIYGIAGGMEEKQVLQRAGKLFVGAIQREITELQEPPNALSTIRRKGSSNPLIDTGLMRSKVMYKLKK